MRVSAQFRARVGSLGGGACLLALLAMGGPAAAAPKPITGKLSEPGYTVIALAANGKATSVRARTGVFRLRPRADTVTLHLRARDGTYAGPIVAGHKGKRAIMGVRAGARLGGIRVRKGYGRVSKRRSSRLLDATRTARARNGVPIGAGNFGRVRSRHPRNSVPGDRDLDGIPDVLDIDDDGDRILDNLDRSTAARAAQVATEFDFGFSTNLTLSMHETANANALTLTDALIEAALPGFGSLLMRFPPGDSAELDCGGANQSPARPEGLVYCSIGGTGRVFKAAVNRSDFPRFPDCCDPDGDGFGTLTGTPIGDGPERSSFFLAHGATSAQIRTGDVLIERVTRGGVESQLPAAVQYIFATVPALVSYSDGQGNAATVSYPVAGPDPDTGIGPSGPGTRDNGILVDAGPNGDVVVTLKFWRPQRRPIPPETAKWIDIGRLNYTAGLGDVGLACRQNAFSEQDPNLTLPASPINLHDNDDGGFTDLAADQPASPANTFTYTLNLTKCLATHGRSFNSGATRVFYFAGVDATGSDDAQQYIAFKRQ